MAQESRECDAEVEITHDRAANHSHKVGEKSQERQCNHKPGDTRQHQNVDRVEADGLHRVDFFVHAHGADLRGEGRARTARNDDGGDEAAHFAQYRDAEKVDGKNFCAEAPQLIRALISQHHPDQERQQPHDGQRVDAGFFHLMDEGFPAKLFLRTDGLNRLDRHAAEISQHLVALVYRMHEAAADAIEEGRPARFFGRRGLVFALQRAEQRPVSFGDNKGADFRAAIFQRPLGAQKKPRTGAIQLVEFFAVDLGFADFGEIERAQLRVQPGGFRQRPVAANDKAQNIVAPLGFEPGAFFYRPYVAEADHPEPTLAAGCASP